MFFKGLLEMSMAGDNSNHYICYYVRKALCHEQLMEAGIYALELPADVSDLLLTFG